MNFFKDLYDTFKEMGLHGGDFDHMLNALPWKEVKNEDGTITYVCEVKK